MIKLIKTKEDIYTIFSEQLGLYLPRLTTMAAIRALFQLNIIDADIEDAFKELQSPNKNVAVFGVFRTFMYAYNAQEMHTKVGAA